MKIHAFHIKYDQIKSNYLFFIVFSNIRSFQKNVQTKHDLVCWASDRLFRRFLTKRVDHSWFSAWNYKKNLMSLFDFLTTIVGYVQAWLDIIQVNQIKINIEIISKFWTVSFTGITELLVSAWPGNTIK